VTEPKKVPGKWCPQDELKPLVRLWMLRAGVAGGSLISTLVFDKTRVDLSRRAIEDWLRIESRWMGHVRFMAILAWASSRSFLDVVPEAAEFLIPNDDD